MNPREGCEEMIVRIAALAAGRFDALTPAEVAGAEAHLNGCARCAAQLAGVQAGPEPAIGMSGAAGGSPSEAEWDAVWRAVEPTVGRLRLRPVEAPVRPGWWGAWSALAAAAAIVLSVGWYRWGGQNEPAWGKIELAGGSDVEIQSVEVGEDDTTFVVNVGAGGRTPVVWVIERGEGA